MNTRQEGFTIAEVIVSMVMLGVVLTTLGGMIFFTAQQTLVAENTATRNVASLETVNRLMTLPYASLPGAVGCDTVGTTNNRYRRCVTVTTAGAARTVRVSTRALQRRTTDSTYVTFVRMGPPPSNPLCLTGC